MAAVVHHVKSNRIILQIQKKVGVYHVSKAIAVFVHTDLFLVEQRNNAAKSFPATHQRNYGIVLCLFGNTVSRLQQNVWQFHMRSRSVSIFFGPDPRVILARFHQSWVWPMRACPLTVRRIGGSTSCEQLSPVQTSMVSPPNLHEAF